MHRPPVEPALTFTQGTADARYLTDEQQLKQIARQFVEDYPDIHGTAYAQASKLLLTHTGKRLDPEKVYWHRFHNAMSSPRTFTGWQHSGMPYESMNFVELLLRRFTAHDQLASDELQLYGGFYTDGPAHGVFDERNEVRLLPMQVMNDFWALDFNQLFQARMDSFWVQHSDNFCTLARSRFLAAAGQQLRAGQLTLSQFKNLMGAVVGKLEPVMTLSTLHTRINAPRGITLRSFDIGGYPCSESFRVVNDTGWQILYFPADEQPFHVFASDSDLYHWVQRCLSQPATRLAFMALFLRTHSAQQQHQAQFDDNAQRIVQTPWVAGQRLINSSSRTIPGNAFEYLRDLARQQLQEDARVLLTSNSDLRKRMWMGYLDAFISVFGSFAPLGWPMALTLVGAGAANVGLRTDQAINGKSARERKAGLVGAIFNAIFLLFNLPTLVGLSRAASVRPVSEPAGVEASATESSGITPSNEMIPLVDIRDPLEGLEGNVILAADAPTAVGRMQGIQQLANGETWINLNDMPYRVLYSDELNSWRIVDPTHATDSNVVRAVRLNALQEWELVDQPEGSVTLPTANPLSPTKPYATVRSSFWDIHMQFNLPEEERFSQMALARQEAVINVREVHADDLMLETPTGSRVVIDSSGNEHWVFKAANGDFAGDRIKPYSVRDSMFNQFLRTGSSQGEGQAGLIEDLADDLLEVGRNNDVNLYRGGSALRGTSGHFFRSGRIKAGNVLVTTDITSFSENPFIARVFCSSQAGQDSAAFALTHEQITFDDSAVVFELPAKHYLGGIPVALFSATPQEAESIFMPGHYFLIDGIQEVTGLNFKFMRVQLTEIPQPKTWHVLLDMRTGEPFSREQYAAKLGDEGKPLVDRFFPAPDEALSV
ncbi:dermonecrotic toxin domain-containing protein [Pseudomonas sp. Irchel 3A5]|uniref:dermonecrotic toxin domain-containing protein n=1 Tax=Pseudomonas sp. Irchel 3A5 TaxID=2008911 RepID=UPI002114DE02|nr:DUF6543 domain-containing protein [Pseudomonas sp. Irchel 3A5]